MNLGLQRQSRSILLRQSFQPFSVPFSFRFSLRLLLFFYVIFSPCGIVLSSSAYAQLSSGVQAHENYFYKEFTKTQRIEFRALEHQQKLDWKEFKTLLERKQKEWEAHEKKQRKQYFTDHPQWSERRVYIQDFLKRREEFRKSLDAERAEKLQDQRVALKTFREGQDDRLKRWLASQKTKAQPKNEPEATVSPASVSPLGPVQKESAQKE
ncbi:MAG: hypothetical protein ACO3A2_00490 [Bdellovibrionia bacterium]